MPLAGHVVFAKSGRISSFVGKYSLSLAFPNMFHTEKPVGTARPSLGIQLDRAGLAGLARSAMHSSINHVSVAFCPTTLFLFLSLCSLVPIHPSVRKEKTQTRAICRGTSSPSTAKSCSCDPCHRPWPWPPEFVQTIKGCASTE